MENRLPPLAASRNPVSLQEHQPSPIVVEVDGRIDIAHREELAGVIQRETAGAASLAKAWETSRPRAS